MIGYIHSVESLSTIDGTGVRSVVFMQGCPLKCPYCHNVDTRELLTGETYTVEQLHRQLKRYYSYIRDGGVTFSGGEPLVQAEFLSEIAEVLSKDGINIAIDTAGFELNDEVKKVLEYTDLVLLDIKSVYEEEYFEVFGMKMETVLNFLEYVNGKEKRIWIRQVIVEGFNDGGERIQRLREILEPYKNIEKTELLPFKKMCKYKWDNLGMEFTFDKYPETSASAIKRLTDILKA